MQPAQVTKVIDGDTLQVLLKGKPERIRLIGIDCPERGELGYFKAQYLTRYYINQSQNIVFLELGTPKRDTHNRLRAYVWLQIPQNYNTYKEVSNHLLNAKLLAHNCAKPMPIHPADNPKYRSIFRFIHQKTPR